MAKASRRAVLSTGLGLGGMLGMAAVVAADEDPVEVPATAAPPLALGTIDMDAVFRDFDKVEATSAAIKDDAEAKRRELEALVTQAQLAAQAMSAFVPGSPDFLRAETKARKLKIQIETEREEAQIDFAHREADALAGLLGEVQRVVAEVARRRGLTHVLRVSNEPIVAADEKSVAAALARGVLYADPRSDITREVVDRLNNR